MPRSRSIRRSQNSEHRFPKVQRAAIETGAPCEASILVQLTTASVPFKSDVGSSCRGITDQNLPKGISIFSNLVSTPIEQVLASNRVLIASNNNLLAHHQNLDPNDFGVTQGNSSSHDPAAQKDTNPHDVNNQTESFKKKSWANWTISNCKRWNGCNSSDRHRIGVIDLAFGTQGSIDYDLQHRDPTSTSSTGTIIARRSIRPNGKKKCIAISRRIGLTRIGHYHGGLTPDEITENGQCTAVDWSQQ